METVLVYFEYLGLEISTLAPSIEAVKDGFFIDNSNQYTKNVDLAVWIPPHKINHVVV